MYKQKNRNNNFRRIDNFDGLTYNNGVPTYDPSDCDCDVQFELVRVQTSPFNPWYPIVQEEVRTSYYDKEDPWKTEQLREQMIGNINPNFKQQSAPQSVLYQTNNNQVTFPQQQQINQMYGKFMPPTPPSQQQQNMYQFRPANNGVQQLPNGVGAGGKMILNMPNNSCGFNGKSDTQDSDCEGKYATCFSPACSSTRECRDYNGRSLNKPYWSVIVSPTI